MDEGVEVSEIIDEIDYDFIDTTTKAKIGNTEILEFEVEDSE